MCTTNQLKKDAETAESHGRRSESNSLESRVLEKSSSKARREFEKKKTKNKLNHKKDPNGEVKFEKMKQTKKIVGKELKKNQNTKTRGETKPFSLN